MMTMSKALGATQTKRYHQEQLRNASENYYSEGQEIVGQWDGQLAEAWGLVGAVDDAQFARVADGHHPFTDEPLVRLAAARELATADSSPTAEHRAAWDLTISAPKSVSVTALVGGDTRVREAHREAVDAALRAAEPYVQARIGGTHPAETTGQWVAAKFEHDSARPVAGYSAPQLHTHTVVFNVTTTADGRTRAVQPRELYRTQQYATAVYRSALATRLSALGYEIERGESGQPEIRGYTPEYLEASSPRRQQIEQVLEQEGRRGAAAAQIAALSTREAKSQAPRDEVLAQHQSLAQAFGGQPSRVVERAHTHTPVSRPDAGARRQALAYARDRNLERDAVPHERDYLRDALSRSMGHATVAEIRAEFDQEIRRGALVEVPQAVGRPGRAYTTPAMVTLEQQTIAAVRQGQARHDALIRPVTQAAIARDYADVSADQREAALAIFQNRDRVQALEGVAGAGKTTTLTAVRDAAERDGYRVKGLAPTGRAAHQLADAGLPTTTLQRHLVGPPADDARPHLYVLDESSLASTKQMHTFFSRLQPADRVLLVGDARQHQAVDAGRPYEQLQEAGIAVARLHTIKRQRDPALKMVVERLSAGDVRVAVDRLDAQGRVHAIPDAGDRLQAVANHVLAHPKGTLVVSPDHHSREALNVRIRAALQGSGHVAATDHEVTVLLPRQHLTGVDRGWAAQYTPGDVVRYARGSDTYRMEAGTQARVTAVDSAQNTITVARPDGRAVTYDPRRLQGVTIYREASRAFAVGDRVQFTAPFPTAKVTNREMGTITAINHKHELRIHTDMGKHVRLSVDPAAQGPRAFRHLDHGYAVTSYSSQGLTADRVLLYIDSEHGGERLVNQRLAYVALSRGRHDAHIYTDDRDRLPAALNRAVSKTTAHTVDQAPQSSAPHARLQHDPVSRESLSTRSRTVAPSQRQQPSFSGPRTGQAPSASAPRHTRDHGTAHAATPEAAPRGAARTPGPATGHGHGQGR